MREEVVLHGKEDTVRCYTDFSQSKQPRYGESTSGPVIFVRRDKRRRILLGIFR